MLREFNFSNDSNMWMWIGVGTIPGGSAKTQSTLSLEIVFNTFNESPLYSVPSAQSQFPFLHGRVHLMIMDIPCTSAHCLMESYTLPCWVFRRVMKIGDDFFRFGMNVTPRVLFETKIDSILLM